MEEKKLFQGAKRLEKMYFSPVRKVLERSAEIRSQGKDVISFSAGEPDFPTPKQIKRSTIKAIEENESHYAPNRGLLSLRKEISYLLEEKNQLQYNPNTEILVTVGGAEAVNNAILAIVNPDDEVIVFSPAFMNYENVIALAGGNMVDIPLRFENGFQIDLEELEHKITNKTKLIIVNNPCNPTGVVYKKEIIEGLCKIACQYDLLVLSDEIYNQIIYDDAVCYSVASFSGMKERTITMNGFSKAFAMTGWRVGFLAADEKLFSYLLKIHQYTTTCIPTFIQKGLAESMNLPETKKEVDEMVQAFAKRRKIVIERLSEIKQLQFIKPKGAFYIFVDVSKTGLSGELFAQRLLEEKYVAVVPGIGLGKSCGDFIRISFATDEKLLEEGFNRMKLFVEELNK